MERGKEYYLNGNFVTFWSELKDNKDFVVVEDSDGVLKVARLSSLKDKEDTYEWQRKERYKKELEAITAEAEKNFDEVAEKIVDKALSSLATRIRLNAMFGEPANASFALTVVAELEKMIKDKKDIKEKLTKEVDPFA